MAPQKAAAEKKVGNLVGRLADGVAAAPAAVARPAAAVGSAVGIAVGTALGTAVGSAVDSVRGGRKGAATGADGSESGADAPGSGADPAPDGRSTRWIKHREQRRTAFVAAGVRAVDEHGPNASAEQIAEAAGVSRTVLYRYFRDRDDLGQAIADQVVTAVVDSVLPHLALTPESTPRQIIDSAVEVVIGWLDEHPNLYLFLRGRRNGPSLGDVENTLADRVAELLQLFLVLFGIDAQEAEPTAYGIVGYVESSGAWWLARRSGADGMPRRRFTALVCEGVWNLLDGAARAYGMHIGRDAPLPWDRLAEEHTEAPGV